MKRCGLYARYSSNLQSPTSIEDQLALCRAHAERQGWAVVATFEDAALSGFGVEHRPGYQQLLAAAAAVPVPFEIVLVEDLSRLTRDMAELLRLYHRLRLRGIDLVGVSDGIATGHQGAKIQLAVKGLVNELYLDDLREKTHRGLSGQVARGLSAGGRIFGYRAVPVAPDRAGRQAPARCEIEPREAEIVRRIFREYTQSRSMKAIAHALNAEGLPFPAKDTKRGPARRGWAASAIHTILHNEKYAGMWVWNRTRFLKDPDTGRRRPVPRPPEEWVRQERPELRIVDPELWAAVQARLAFVSEAFGFRAGRPRGGRASTAYSGYLLSGIVRCGACGARMVGQSGTRRKGARLYRSARYVCGFAASKGPAVCRHSVGYRRDRLEAALLGRFRGAMTAPMLDALAAMINERIAAAHEEHAARADTLKAEVLQLEREAGNLVRFLAQGGESATVREELRVREDALRALRVELAELLGSAPSAPPRVHPTWIRGKLERLDTLVREDPTRAKAEILKHLDGELVLRPLPSEAGERRAEIRGRAKLSGLLEGQEAVAQYLGCGGWI